MNFTIHLKIIRVMHGEDGCCLIMTLREVILGVYVREGQIPYLHLFVPGNLITIMITVMVSLIMS